MSQDEEDELMAQLSEMRRKSERERLEREAQPLDDIEQIAFDMIDLESTFVSFAQGRLWVSGRVVDRPRLLRSLVDKGWLEEYIGIDDKDQPHYFYRPKEANKK